MFRIDCLWLGPFFMVFCHVWSFFIPLLYLSLSILDPISSRIHCPVVYLDVMKTLTIEKFQTNILYEIYRFLMVIWIRKGANAWSFALAPKCLFFTIFVPFRMRHQFNGCWPNTNRISNTNGCINEIVMIWFTTEWIRSEWVVLSRPTGYCATFCVYSFENERFHGTIEAIL